ncbi:hypothetical protein MPER_12220 [Moniliophthora perniciosa FA553]|nr:hypothetical protein MPER_12220 [Moniliophthora perniciosa FA553]
MLVVYVCPEMVESPSFASVLHSEQFQARLSAVYLDEGHLPKETHHWRPSYKRLNQLRAVIGSHVPLIVLSATAPTPHRQFLVEHAGLRKDHVVINLGNYRPELLQVVIPMQHAHSSFMDIAFVLPLDICAEDIKKTLIYCDDLDMLTEMFWWFFTRLTCLNFSPFYVDIIHAGLSEEHQMLCLRDFRNDTTEILLASEKVGAGMDFKGVEAVVQYKCRGLTIATWEQRRGRGARDPGTSAVGYLMVEASMRKDSAEYSAAEQDPGILELVQDTDKCRTFISDFWMENPDRADKGPVCGHCSTCCPALLPTHQFQFVAVYPESSVQAAYYRRQIPKTGSDAVLEKLKEWLRRSG